MYHDDHRLRTLSLTFVSDRLEAEYQAQYLPRLRVQARIALALGALQYMAFGFYDTTYLPAAAGLERLVWTVRLLALAPGFAILLLLGRPVFASFAHELIGAAGFFAGLGMLATLLLLPADAVVHYYPAFAVLMAWIYNLSGIRFPHACITGFIITIGYNVIFLVFRSDLPLSMLLLHDFILLSANCIGMFSAYLVERQRRRLFVNERQLDQQRRESLQQALHDALTGLPNRTLLDDRLQQAINQAERGRYLCAGLYIDLDGFKPLNDTHGHEGGDYVLKEVAARLRDAMRDADTVARIGGDEFFVLAPQSSSSESAMAFANKLRAILQTPIWLPDDAQMVTVGASIGVCLFPFPGATPELVIQRADRSMYAAKRDGRGRAVLSNA